jgi:hypothetical protein
VANMQRNYRVGARRVAILHFCLDAFKELPSVVNIVYEHLRMAYDVGSAEKRLLIKTVAFDLDSRSSVDAHNKRVAGAVGEIKMYASCLCLCI